MITVLLVVKCGAVLDNVNKILWHVLSCSELLNYLTDPCVTACREELEQNKRDTPSYTGSTGVFTASNCPKTANLLIWQLTLALFGGLSLK